MTDPRETAIRYLTTLSLIPMEPAKIATTTLLEKLKERGFSVTSRSLQRDLKDKLSAHFPLQCDEAEKPYRWSFVKDSHFNLPALDTARALALFLAEEQLRDLLPQSVTDQLNPQFEAARQYLTNLQENGLANWTKKVRALPSGRVLVPAAISESVWRNTTEALLFNKQIKVEYLSRDTGKKNKFTLHPAGLVSRYSVSYLIAHVDGYEDLRHFALHRFKYVEVLENEAVIDAKFRLDEHIKDGRFNYRECSQRVTLVADIHPNVAWLLKETPLSRTQKIQEIPKNETAPEGWERLTASVNMDRETLWWVYSMNNQIRLHAPQEWVDEIKQSLLSLNELYAVT